MFRKLDPADHRADPPQSAPSPKLPQVFRFSFEDCRYLLTTEMGKHYRNAAFKICERRAAEKVGSGAFCQLVDPLNLTATNLFHRLTSQHFSIQPIPGTAGQLPTCQEVALPLELFFQRGTLRIARACGRKNSTLNLFQSRKLDGYGEIFLRRAGCRYR
jgi:hypothetical protein